MCAKGCDVDDPEFPWTIEQLEQARELLTRQDGGALRYPPVLDALRIVLLPLVEALIVLKKNQ
jgi:hypothetical protein